MYRCQYLEMCLTGGGAEGPRSQFITNICVSHFTGKYLGFHICHCKIHIYCDQKFMTRSKMSVVCLQFHEESDS